jgi:rfaE bifunctional protein nucleotidyltransferase chain/domain
MLFESISKKVLDASQLAEIRKINQHKKIVFCTGCYDILQSGHAVFFNQCKAYGDILVVGVGRDSTIKTLKGPARPVNPENNRVYLVAALQDVDFAVLNDVTIKEGKIDFEQVLNELKPDIFVLNDDDGGIESKSKLCNTLGIKIELVKREVPQVLEATSTTRIIDRINFSYKAPLRIDFAGGWTDIPNIMNHKIGYVSNMAIKPHVELKTDQLNMGGYPRGSGLSTSTAVELLKMLSSKNYNADSRSLTQIGEDLFNLENKELNWMIGRQDQYAIVYGGFNCFEFGDEYGKQCEPIISKEILTEFRKGLLLLHTGVSRNAQLAVEQVYQNYNTPQGQGALDKLAQYGKDFVIALSKSDFNQCAQIMSLNFEAQKQLAAASSNEIIDAMYKLALQSGAIGGKICGAGGGGAFIFYCSNPLNVKNAIKARFTDCFEIDFDIEWKNIKELNRI